MPQLPDRVEFKCEKCERLIETSTSKVKSFFSWNRKLEINNDGGCRNCGGTNWTMSVYYVQVDDNTVNAFDILMYSTVGFTRGMLMPQTAAISQTAYAGVSGDFLVAINKEPGKAIERITAFASHREREQLKEQGARECIGCGAIYVLEAEKPWTSLCYCTKMCAIEHGERSFIPELVAKEAPAPREKRSLTVTCANGHDFAVGYMFRGMKRPCPECGEKVEVPPGE